MSDTAPRRPFAKWTRLLFATPSGGPAVDGALVAVRIALAWIFIYYGAAKLFGAFPGDGPHGIHQTARFMSETAHLRPGEFFAVVGGLVEFGGGVAMAVGFCTRLAGLALFGDMVMATITVSWDTGLNSISNPPGYQVNLAVGALALAAALAGAGRFSVDAIVARALGRGTTVRSSGADRSEAAWT
jgi:putative oxidoreductase